MYDVNSRNFLLHRAKTVIDMMLVMLSRIFTMYAGFICIQEQKKWNKNIWILPFARQNLCAPGQEPYSFFYLTLYNDEVLYKVYKISLNSP